MLCLEQIQADYSDFTNLVVSPIDECKQRTYGDFDEWKGTLKYRERPGYIPSELNWTIHLKIEGEPKYITSVDYEPIKN